MDRLAEDYPCERECLVSKELHGDWDQIPLDFDGDDLCGQELMGQVQEWELVTDLGERGL
jgi:hypothetical protein